MEEHVVMIAILVIERYVGSGNHGPPCQGHRGYTSNLTATSLYLSEPLQSLD